MRITSGSRIRFLQSQSARKPSRSALITGVAGIRPLVNLLCTTHFHAAGSFLVQRNLPCCKSHLMITCKYCRVTQQRVPPKPVLQDEPHHLIISAWSQQRFLRVTLTYMIISATNEYQIDSYHHFPTWPRRDGYTKHLQ
jgi:hypothetical protein